MGYELQRWALTEQHPCLTPRTRLVLAAICMVAHDDHGEFWMRGKQLIAKHLPGMSYSSYKNHLGALVRNEFLIKLEHGGGRTSGGRGKSNRYRVNAPSVTPQQPPQGVLPEISRSPDTSPLAPKVQEEQQSVDVDTVHKRLDDLLFSGITPAQMMTILQAIEDSMSATPRDSGAAETGQISRETGQVEGETGQIYRETGNETCPVSEKQVTESVQFDRNRSQNLSSLDEETRQVDEKQVTKSDQFGRNRTGFMTPAPIHEEKRGEDKEHAAAAACETESERNRTGQAQNLSRELTGFFDVLVAALAKSGYSGIRPAQFDDLSELLADYEAQTGEPPGEQTADYIVGRLQDSPDVRNVVGFLRTLTSDVLRTGEGYVASVPGTAREPPPPEPDPPDWQLLHLAHVEQVAPAQQVWASALEVLRSEVSRPAFETWVEFSRGVAYTNGVFLVGAESAFVAEMLKHRMHPLVERAVRDVTGEVLAIEYAVEAEGDETCPVCESAEEVNAAAS